ncbi:hypothetical protein [Nitrosopumilus maritimus]|uniref:hypothetical protein n=1 Tax=Nitrosopumilus maritimus TaxID=338192 RepID=UPI000159AEEA|nr:hypothetical protein [Nitrosopumilus maritimus]
MKTENLAKLSQSQIKELVFNYVVPLKDLTDRTGKPSPNPYNTLLTTKLVRKKIHSFFTATYCRISNFRNNCSRYMTN